MVIHWQDYVVSEGLMLGVVLGDIEFWNRYNISPFSNQYFWQHIYMAYSFVLNRLKCE